MLHRVAVLAVYGIAIGASKSGSSLATASRHETLHVPEESRSSLAA